MSYSTSTGNDMVMPVAPMMGNYGGSYDDGRSMHSVKDQAIQRLEQLMDSAQSDFERDQVRKMIEAVEAQKR